MLHLRKYESAGDFDYFRDLRQELSPHEIRAKYERQPSPHFNMGPNGAGLNLMLAGPADSNPGMAETKKGILKVAPKVGTSNSRDALII